MDESAASNIVTAPNKKRKRSKGAIGRHTGRRNQKTKRGGTIVAVFPSKREPRMMETRLEMLIAENKKMAAKIITQDKQITSLKLDLEGSLKLLDKTKKITASKDKTIASLESEVKNDKTNDIVDLASEGSERANKRPRAGKKPKSSLAILHKQNKRLVQVKQEKNAVVTTSNSVPEEREAMEAELEESEVKNDKTNDIVDLTSEGSELANKRPRAGNTPKSSLAILHKQNKRLVQVKQEKNAVVTTLNSVREEKEAMEADLEGAREDLEDANECVKQTYLGQDIWNRRFDELADLAEAGQVDRAVIFEIRNRSLATGS